MFRKIWKWTKGDSILADVLGYAANRFSGGIIAQNRTLGKLEEHFTDGEKNQWL